MAAGRSTRTDLPSPSRTETLYAFDRALQCGLAANLLSLEQLTAEAQEETSVAFRPESVSRRSLSSLAGCDEAGRGALAGPAVVACVHFPTFAFPEESGQPPKGETDLLERLDGLDDSKRLSAQRREALFEEITTLARWGVGTATPAEIDGHGIVPACALAARRAHRAMEYPVEVLLLDRGLSLHPLSESQGIKFPRQLSLTKGDARSFHIAAASILAKVTRDRMMAALHSRFPVYGFSQNKGYGTAAHRESLRRCGPSPLHRLTYRLSAEAPGPCRIDS
jgi:ribonuclease HII